MISGQRAVLLIGSVVCTALFVPPYILPQTTLPKGPDIQAHSQGQSCIEPARMFSMSDYEGPMRNLVTSVARKVEVNTVPRQQHQTAAQPCLFSPRKKFVLFVRNSVEPITILGAGLNAGLAQAANADPQFGQGGTGYFQRFGVALADSTSGEFFGSFLYPVIFRQDPRYYRMGQGSSKQRLRKALAHVFVAHSDSGKSMFNYSEWLGTISTTTLHNVYHPGNRLGFEPTASRIGITLGTDMGFAILREFWPDVSRKFKLPFRAQESVAYVSGNPARRTHP